MSRIAKNPVTLPAGVTATLHEQALNVQGAKGTLELDIHADVEVSQLDSQLTFAARNDGKFAVAMSGTTRALVNNMVIGVSEGFTKTLLLQEDRELNAFFVQGRDNYRVPLLANPKKSLLTRIILKQYHDENHDASPALVQALVYKRFYVMGGAAAYIKNLKKKYMTFPLLVSLLYKRKFC